MVIVIIQSRVVRLALDVMRRKVAVNGRVRVVVVALVHVLRSQRRPCSHDSRQEQDSRCSNPPKHRRDYGLCCLDGQTTYRPFTFTGKVALPVGRGYFATYGQFQPRSSLLDGLSFKDRCALVNR